MSEQSITMKKPKRARRRPRRSRGKRGAKAIPALAAKVATLSKRVGRPEIKYATANYSALVDYNGTLNGLSTITQGAGGVNQREGDGLTVKSINFRYHAYITTATALSMLRVILFVDEQANMTAGTVLATVGSGLSPLSFYNKEYKGRYRVLYDKTHSLDTGQALQDLEMVKVSKDVHMVFNPGTSTVRANEIRVLLISNQAAASADRPGIDYNCRLYYQDD